MLISFRRPGFEVTNYAVSISKAYTSRWNAKTGKTEKNFANAGRILSSTTNKDMATQFCEEDCQLVKNWYAQKENRLNHQISLDNL